MNLIRVRPEAEVDVRETVEWYEAQRIGLGIEFVLELDAAIERAALNPEAYPVQHGGARRVMIRRFPYSVYYVPSRCYRGLWRATSAPGSQGMAIEVALGAA